MPCQFWIWGRTIFVNIYCNSGLLDVFVCSCFCLDHSFVLVRDLCVGISSSPSAEQLRQSISTAASKHECSSVLIVSRLAHKPPEQECSSNGARRPCWCTLCLFQHVLLTAFCHVRCSFGVDLTSLRPHIIFVSLTAHLIVPVATRSNHRMF